jgi:hypothetical protein
MSVARVRERSVLVDGLPWQSVETASFRAREDSTDVGVLGALEILPGAC